MTTINHRSNDVFSLGMWTDRLPMLDHIDAGYGFDSRHKEHTKLLTEISSLHSAQLDKLKFIIGQKDLAIIEAENQHLEVINVLKSQTFDIVTRLDNLEQALGGYLECIRSVLGNINDQLGAMLNILVMPLGTKAAELIRDGNNALKNGFVDDAIVAFQEALEHKHTDYVALSSLAFAQMNKGEIDASIENFRKAVAYVPVEADATSKAIALENLSRAYYVSKDYAAAYEFSGKARTVCPNRNTISEYRHIVYSYLSGDEANAKEMTEALCVKEPRYFLNFTTDPDLEQHRSVVLSVLNQLCREVNNRARDQCDREGAEIEAFLANLVQSHKDFALGINLLRDNLAKTREYIESGSYTRAKDAITILERLKGIIPILSEFASLEKNLEETNFSIIESKYNNAISEYEYKKKAFEDKKREDLEAAKIVVKTRERMFRNWFTILPASVVALLSIFRITYFLIYGKERDSIIVKLIFLIPSTLIVGCLLGFIVVAICNLIGNHVIPSGKKAVEDIEARVMDVEYPEAIRQDYDTAISNRKGQENRLKSLRTQIESMRNNLNVFPVLANGTYLDNTEIVE
jgi:hypothetical protein